jgi:hypothetical protein
VQKKNGFVDGHLLVRSKKTFLNGNIATIWLQVGYLTRFQPIKIHPNILYVETTAHIWSDLKALKIYQLKQSISALKQEDMFVSLFHSTQISLE